MGRMRSTTVVRLVLAAGFVAALAAAGAGCSSRSPTSGDLLVFAAASVARAMSDIGSAYERQHGYGVAFSFGASQSMAQQIARGAPADVFISAGRFPMDFLAARGGVVGSEVDILANELVLVVRPGMELDSLGDLVASRVELVAIASPDLAPAGRYAREALQRLGIWDALQDKLVVGADVRATLTYVETGNVDAALVYVTDARTASGVVVLDVVPPESYAPIVYPAAVVSTTNDRGRARSFLAFLKGDQASGIFRSHGFKPLE